MSAWKCDDERPDPGFRISAASLGKYPMAEANTVFQDAEKFAAHLRVLREERLKRKLEIRSLEQKRQSLTPTQRSAVLIKTAGRCHICGGHINSEWATDHVLAHAQGGEHTVDNYLPAHAICNRARWFYSTEEF
jgi:5-methylcytosine-specific restriction endonuclease McrA